MVVILMLTGVVGTGSVDLERCEPLGRADFVTIILTAVTVVLAALMIILAIAAVWGYTQIKEGAEGVAREKAKEKAERVAQDVASEVAMREARALMAQFNGAQTDGEAVMQAMAEGENENGA